MGEYRLPETVVERGAAEVGRRERLSPTGDRAYGTAKAVLTAALNLNDDPVERVARALLPDPYICRKCARLHPYLDLMGNPMCPCGNDRFIPLPNAENVGEHLARAALHALLDPAPTTQPPHDHE